MARSASIEATTDTLANLAFDLLVQRGKAEQPTHCEVTHAVIDSAAKAGLWEGDAETTDIYLAVIDQLATKHHWHLGNVIELDPHRRANGFQHR